MLDVSPRLLTNEDEVQLFGHVCVMCLNGLFFSGLAGLGLAVVGVLEERVLLVSVGSGRQDGYCTVHPAALQTPRRLKDDGLLPCVCRIQPRERMGETHS